MSRNLIKPFFARPPEQYDEGYMADLVRSFALYLDQMQNPGEGRHNRLTLTDLPSSDQGLEIGALFQSSDTTGTLGFVKVVQGNQPNLAGVTGTGAVGSVTVTT